MIAKDPPWCFLLCIVFQFCEIKKNHQIANHYLNLLMFKRFNRSLFCLWKREGKRSGRLLKAFYSQAFILSFSFLFFFVFVAAPFFTIVIHFLNKLGDNCRLFLFLLLFLSLLLSLQLSLIFSTSLEGRCQLFQWNLDPVTLDWTVFPLKDFEV